MTNGNQKPTEAPSCCGAGSCCSGPAKWIWSILVIAVAAVLIAKTTVRKEAAPPAGLLAAARAGAEDTGGKEPAGVPSQRAAIPRLVDLGAGQCIPCRMMAPILEELKREYANSFKTEFIDVWQNPEPGRRYGIRVIPTQIFFDAQGKELFRHEGFFGKEDILAKWKELGVNLAGK